MANGRIWRAAASLGPMAWRFFTSAGRVFRSSPSGRANQNIEHLALETIFRFAAGAAGARFVLEGSPHFNFQRFFTLFAEKKRKKKKNIRAPLQHPRYVQ